MTTKHFCKNCHAQKVHMQHPLYCVGCLVVNHEEFQNGVCYDYLARQVKNFCVGCWRNKAYYHDSVFEHEWQTLTVQDNVFKCCSGCIDHLWKYSVKYQKLNNGLEETNNNEKKMSEYTPKKHTKASDLIMDKLDDVMQVVQDVDNQLQRMQEMQSHKDLEIARMSARIEQMQIVQANITQTLGTDVFDKLDKTADYLQSFEKNTYNLVDMLFEKLKTSKQTTDNEFNNLKDQYGDIKSLTKAIEQEIISSRRKTIIHVDNATGFYDSVRSDLAELKDWVIDLVLPYGEDPDTQEALDQSQDELSDDSSEGPPALLTPIEAVDENGNREIYFRDDDGYGFKHGTYRKTAPNGQLIELFNFVAGKKHGECIEYIRESPTTGIIIKGQYTNDRKTGVWTSYEFNPAGQRIVSQCTYEDGKLNGPCSGAYNNPFCNEKYVGNYSEDHRTGKWTYWNQKSDNSTKDYICCTEYYHKGELQGPRVRYGPDGDIISEEMFVNGESVQVST